MLNAKEFSRKYAEAYGVSYKQATTICQSVFDFLGETIYQDKEDVVIYGFGSFKHKKTAPKRVKHPSTGEMMTMPPRDMIKFTPSGVAYDETNT